MCLSLTACVFYLIPNLIFFTFKRTSFYLSYTFLACMCYCLISRDMLCENKQHSLDSLYLFPLPVRLSISNGTVSTKLCGHVSVNGMLIYLLLMCTPLSSRNVPLWVTKNITQSCYFFLFLSRYIILPQSMVCSYSFSLQYVCGNLCSDQQNLFVSIKFCLIVQIDR